MMDTIKQHLKFHLVLIVLLAIGLGSALLYFPLQADRERPMVTIRHLSGDPEVLEGLVINGTFGDSYHKTDFTISNYGSTASTEIYPLARALEPWRYGTSFFTYWMGNSQIRVQDYIDEHIITREDQLNGISYGTATIRPEMRYTPIKGAVMGRTFTNPVEYGITHIGESVYYILPTTIDYTGSTSIYELAFITEDMVRRGESAENRKVAEIVLDGNAADSSNGTTVEIIGLEAVGDQLVLITSENGVLTATGYDPATGQELGKATIDAVRFGETAPSGFSYRYNYEVVADESADMLHLYFITNGRDAGLLDTTVISLDVSDGISLLGLSTEEMKPERQFATKAVAHMSWHHGRQYLIRYEAIESGIPGVMSIHGQPHQVAIYVYESGERIYSGELTGKVIGDSFQTVYQMPDRGLVGDTSSNRTLERIDIQKAGEEGRP
ncbi:hypothetical protein [Paenibacillus daejeonensis]|uniref:hypothetical protein n=1 Tax=Paenibacillus daejeonensis TaxID=135193 RepID=UPI00037A1187|nr:hypothetical protein [Paenibacillus daejeonensis]